MTGGAERLEDRTLLAAFLVNTVEDADVADAFLTLREAVAQANARSDADTITFAAALSGRTITLGGTAITISADLTITGPGANRLAVSGKGASGVFRVNSGVTAAIRGLTITGGNTAGSGGGISNAGTLVLKGCAVTGNRADFSGGAIASISEASAVRIDGCTFSGNRAEFSGGFYFGNGTLSVSNSTISGNEAKAGAGGFFSNGPATLRNVTLSGNRADADGDGSGGGGAIFATSIGPSTTTLHNTLVTGNVRGTGAGTADEVSGTLAAASSFNLIADAATAGGLVNGTNGNIVGVAATTTLDPVLRDNGGPTKTHALRVNSRAINGGSDAQALDSAGNPLAGDQRGLRRSGFRSDIGAYEHHDVVFVRTLSDEDDGDYSTADVSLREAVRIVGDQGAVAFANGAPGGTITLTLGQLVLDRFVDIHGPGADRLAVSGGGASRVFEITSGALVRIENLTVTGGNGEGGGTGGGILNRGVLLLAGCVVTRNRTGDFGGGIHSAPGASLSVVDTTVSGNTATGNGGGISSEGGLVVSNSTVSGNTADFSGGGVALGAGFAVLRNVTVFGNRADARGTGGFGGGLFVGSGSATVHNTLVAGNLRGGGAGVADDVRGQLAAASSFNVIAHAATAGGLATGTNGNVVGVSLAGLIDPVLRGNGGSTPTHKLLVGSPAIDAGDDAQARDTFGISLTRDQRGSAFGRALQGGVDIGAFEAAPAEDLMGFIAGSWFVGETTGTAFATAEWARWANVAWQALRQGDFNGDGRTDVLGLFNGQWFVGESNGDAFATRLWGAWANVAWEHVTVGDIDGDGRDDVLAEFSGQWFGARSNGAAFDGPALRTTTANAAWDFVGLADVDGGGRDDLVLMLDGQWFVGVSNGSAFGLAQAPTWANAAYQLLALADVSGDGQSDLVGFIAGEWYVGRGRGGTFVAPVLRAKWANVVWTDPLLGDFDGDGRDDVAARFGGQWFVGQSDVVGREARLALWETWSNVAWRDVRSGDYDGDGRDDLAGRFFGQWFVGESTGAAFTTSFRAQWAEVAWLAVAAADASGHEPIGASGGSAVGTAGLRLAPGPVAVRSEVDEPLAAFWRAAEEDEEFSGLLAAV